MLSLLVFCRPILVFCSDVWVYEASTYGTSGHRHIPQRFKDGCLYPNVRFFDRGCSEAASYTSVDPSGIVTWYNPPTVTTPPSARVTDILVDAAYVINMPILKRNGSSCVVSLSFKNHFGSIVDPGTLHPWVMGEDYDASYSPLVDIYRNPNIAGKTVLTVGDGLFGNKVDNLSDPSPWLSLQQGTKQPPLFHRSSGHQLCHE